MTDSTCSHRDWTCFYEEAGRVLAYCQRCRQESAWCSSKANAEANLKETGGFRARLGGSAAPEVFTK